MGDEEGLEEGDDELSLTATTMAGSIPGYRKTH